jgi:hypothetical protein
LELDTNKEDEIHLCSVFKEHLDAKRDLLEDPEACHEQDQCPLKGLDPRTTVCPFGFWGFLHQIEQPLQHIDPLQVDVDRVPEKLRDPSFRQTSRLVRATDGKLSAVVAMDPGIDDTQDHRRELDSILSQGGVSELTYRQDRDPVLELLRKGGQHLYYFYCHGRTEGIVFGLRMGPRDRPGYISAQDLDYDEIEWPEQPLPLVVLNGCETMALLPERIHLFMKVFRELGACGVVGTEIQVNSLLARPIACLTLKDLLDGMSLGEAFLHVRQQLLREYNPLGLAYTYYAPSTLHLHDQMDCAWCRSHAPASAQTGTS